MYNKTVRNVPANFSCNLCDYNTCRKSQYERHILTRKHIKLENTTNPQQNATQTVQYNCNCGKSYNHRASLFNHKKKCSYQTEQKTEQKLEHNYTELIIKLIKENQELKNTILLENTELRKTITELIPKIGNNNNNNNTINQKFNINVFLNEQCKDALTMNQFIDSIQVTLDNLDVTKNKGLTEGISNIIMENMNKLSIHERPVHCTDIKRETV